MAQNDVRATATHATDEWTPERIKSLRARLGLTLADLAKRCGVSVVAVQRWTFPATSANRNTPSGPSRVILEQLEAEARHRNPMGVALIDPGQTGQKRGIGQNG